MALKDCKVLPPGTPKGQMPPLVLPTHLFGGICRGHVTSRTHRHSRLPPLRVRAAQALPVKGFPKGKPLWSVFGYFLLTKKVTSSVLRGERNKNRMGRSDAEKRGVRGFAPVAF